MIDACIALVYCLASNFGGGLIFYLFIWTYTFTSVAHVNQTVRSKEQEKVQCTTKNKN